jgi:hypothetical protein
MEKLEVDDLAIYKLNDFLNFRVCSFNNCTFKNVHWAEHIKKCSVFDPLGCFHEGDVHLHCVVHREIELTVSDEMKGPKSLSLICSICSLREDYSPTKELRHISTQDITTYKNQSRSLLASEQFKNAKLIRLDDYYTPEISVKAKTTESSKYWMSYDVKENKQGQPILVLYLGNRITGSKKQFFIEPETKKLSHDQSHGDPLEIVSRIEVQFKDGIIELKESDQL